MTPYELTIGLRYLAAKRRNNFISFISGASMIGIALGMTALITVMSVMNGFVKEIRGRMLAVTPHVQVLGSETGLTDWAPVLAKVKAEPGVVAAAPFAVGQGLLANDGVVEGVQARGVLPELEPLVTEVARTVSAGSLDALKPQEFGIVLGADLARKLRTSMGERVTLITPQGNVTPAGMVPRLKQFTVVGIFKSGHYLFDAKTAFIHLRDAQVLFRLGDGVSGIQSKLADIDQAQSVRLSLAKKLQIDGFITDWTLDNKTYFRAVEIEKRMMFIILTLIIAVAAFNLVSTLVMVVTDKESDIAILRTLGASPSSIMLIFIVQGAITGLIGTLAGLGFGLLLAYNVGTIVGTIERVFNLQFLAPEVYFITELPSEVHLNDVGVVALVSLILALLATLYPSWRASRLNPAEALRYE